jgi:opacity protein-like surface antigen
MAIIVASGDSQMTNRAISIVCGAAFVLAASGFAFAADIARKMPVKAPPPAPAPVYNWTGFYVGLNAGGAWSRTDVSAVPNAALPGIFRGPLPSSQLIIPHA